MSDVDLLRRRDVRHGDWRPQLGPSADPILEQLLREEGEL